MQTDLVSLATTIVKILAICDILQSNIFVISFEEDNSGFKGFTVRLVYLVSNGSS